MLATTVAAAVTTPLVFLSAGPAFAETPKPTASKGATAQEDGQDDLDGPDFAEFERLEAAYAAAERKVEDLKAELKQRLKDVDANAVDPALKTELEAARTAAATAAAARATADEELTAAKEALAAVEADAEATPEAKTAAAEAVTAAEAKAAQAAEADTAADTRYKAADKAFKDASVALTQAYDKTEEALAAAEKELAEAEAALDAFWDDEGDFMDCEVDRSVLSTLTGPESVTIGSSADFSLTVKNASGRDLDAVRSVVSAIQLPESWDEIDEEYPNLDKYFSVRWKVATEEKWNDLTSQDEPIELGRIAKGGKVDLTLRVTVDEAAPAGEGIASANSEYDNEDGSCGISEQFAETEFDIVEPKGEEPTPTPTPTPTPSASTAAPAPVQRPNTPVQQGGVNGQLAATGAGDRLPQLAGAAGAAVVLGAGAVFVARRRKAHA
ncbi:hypothetical protein ACFQ8C_05155 [Streptomyces sp. NPDC056503]|uniref:hypothetical protein n=1 Tax=Streptomyces sp. NPDC056503 TaxID=3345842 RepID=UPI0036A56B2D